MSGFVPAIVQRRTEPALRVFFSGSAAGIRPEPRPVFLRLLPVYTIDQENRPP